MLKAGLSLLSISLVATLSPAMALSPVQMRERTAYIAERYLQIWSSNNAAAVTGVPYMYGPEVQFYGKTYTQGQLIDEKRRVIGQWPVRRYVHRPGTMRIDCNVSERKCAVRSIIDFEAANPARQTRKSGSARFDLGISFIQRQPRILYEGGSLNNRRVGRLD
ncbi:MAG: hypothetical protein K2Y56_01375 [Methylobacterium sp.]|uniref:hypothetical protein n=1 Tax=Methylobacterium sp. TaxID=409 RepID=UPI0025F36733|nr:hypothetical protein [Methylobacterium sp.]MBX9930184.1 hypothetical protein [Methylobacterium sp.]